MLRSMTSLCVSRMASILAYSKILMQISKCLSSDFNNFSVCKSMGFGACYMNHDMNDYDLKLGAI